MLNVWTFVCRCIARNFDGRIVQHGYMRGHQQWLSLAIVVGTIAPGWCAVASRNYSFEEGTDGQSTVSVEDAIAELLIVGTGVRDGLFWIEVAGTQTRPIPGGNLQDSVGDVALIAPQLETSQGSAMYVNVADGTAWDSPAVGSRLALQFDGSAAFTDRSTGPGSRGVFIDAAAYGNNAPVASGTNAIENFSLVTQGWVRPSRDGQGVRQTVWQAGGEQGSVNISANGFWEFANLGSVGVLNPNIPVAFDSWTHLGIFRGGNGAEIYLNGELVAGNRSPEPPNFFGGYANIIALGGSESGTAGFIGLVDDFKVMGTADGIVDPALDMDFWSSVPSCDFNGDGVCNILDLNGMLNEGPISAGVTVTPGQNDIYDVTGDGTINLADRNQWLADAAVENGLSAPYPLGDANLDGEVNHGDFGLWDARKFTTATAWDSGDFSGDGEVDGTDFGIWSANRTIPPAGATVPEPSSLGLLGFAISAWLLRARSRR